MTEETTSEPTIAELDAQIADLQKQRDLVSLEGTKAVRGVLSAGEVATLADDLEALLPSLSTDGVAYQQARNVITVMRNGRGLIDADISRVEAMVAAPTEA